MENKRQGKRGTYMALAIMSMAALTASTISPFAGPAHARSITFADPAFEKIWARSDKPVDERVVARSWTWGPEPLYSVYEPYAEGPAGRHLVTYLDKSRMEINNPSGDRNSSWFVTNGLLVVDMITGQIQVGDKMYAPFTPATIPVAGDKNSLDAPTYAALAKVASLRGDNRASNRTGQPVREGLGRAGNVAVLDNLSPLARYATYEPTLGHNIPDVFWSFLNSRGPIYLDGRYGEGPVVDWLFAMGYPITEPYWINIRVGGQSRWVLMQAFQRRILTYSPQNPDGWKVEMGNVGRAYFDWRYNGQPPVAAPTSTPVPPTATTRPVVQGSLSFSPSSGDTNTAITATGAGFARNANVSIRVERAANNYSREVARITAKENGTFSTRFSLPPDASNLGDVTIAAYAGNVSARAPQAYKLVFNPSITVFPGAQVPSGGTLRVQGAGFPARQEVRVGTFAGSVTEWKSSVRADDKGAIDVSFGVGTPPAGSTLAVVALADGGVKATSPRITIVAPPAPQLSLAPNALAPGQVGTVSGSFWPANVPVQVGIARPGGAVQEWVVNTRTDGSGNFTAQFILDARWRNAGLLELKAVVANASKLPRASTSLTALAGGRVVPSGSPMEVKLLFHDGSTTIKAKGTSWGAGKVVNVSVVSGDGLVNVTVSSVAVRPDGRWEAVITPAQPWWGRHDLGIQAVTSDSTQSSVRYLPVFELVRASGGTHTVKGYNWPANARVTVALNFEGQPEEQIAAFTTTVEGAFEGGITIPRPPTPDGNRITVLSADGSYIAYFDY